MDEVVREFNDGFATNSTFVVYIKLPSKPCYRRKIVLYNAPRVCFNTYGDYKKTKKTKQNKTKKKQQQS